MSRRTEAVIGKKSTPAQPAAPDPAATAAAQSQQNIAAATAQANLNRIDQYTPQGSITYNQVGTNADGTGHYAQTQKYSPDQQVLYDQQNQIAKALGGTAMQNISRVNDAQGKDFNFDSMTPLQTGVDTGGIQNGYASGGQIQSNIRSGGNVQRNLDFGSLKPINDNFDSTVKNAQDASYEQAARRLDPQFQQQQSDMTSRLANQGIAVGSDAYNREMANFERDKNDAYNTARLSSQDAGLRAQQQGYGQSLATRQQGAGETSAAGEFANSAQGQVFGQNAAQMQAFNDAQAQRTGQNASQAAFANTAQGQRFAQGSANLATNNAARQQQIQEASYLRNLPLNDIAALLGTGGGVQNPNFQPVSQVGVAAPDYQGAVYANYNAANQQYNQAQQARSQALGSIFGTIGSIGGAALMASDRRIKTAIKRVGTLASGLPTYTFKYIGDTVQRFGIMAQDALHAIPDAVGVSPNGVMYVDYRKVW